MGWVAGGQWMDGGARAFVTPTESDVGGGTFSFMAANSTHCF